MPRTNVAKNGIDHGYGRIPRGIGAVVRDVHGEVSSVVGRTPRPVPHVGNLQLLPGPFVEQGDVDPGVALLHTVEGWGCPAEELVTHVALQRDQAVPGRVELAARGAVGLDLQLHSSVTLVINLVLGAALDHARDGIRARRVRRLTARQLYLGKGVIHKQPILNEGCVTSDGVEIPARAPTGVRVARIVSSPWAER